MARVPLAAREIGDGGVVGELILASVVFPDDGQPTLCNTAIQYIASGAVIDTCTLVWFTTQTQAEIRSLAKDAIRQDIIDKRGIAIPKSQIKMLNSPE